MTYKEIQSKQEEIQKDLTKAQVRFSNVQIDMKALKEDLIKTLEQEGYENVKELLA